MQTPDPACHLKKPEPDDYDKKSGCRTMREMVQGGELDTTNRRRGATLATLLPRRGLSVPGRPFAVLDHDRDELLACGLAGLRIEADTTGHTLEVFSLRERVARASPGEVTLRGRGRYTTRVCLYPARPFR